jgi:hypothetical protein
VTSLTKQPSDGDLYINIGTEKSCYFVQLSFFLLRILEQHPILYYAVEESIICGEKGYFASGIIAFSQILKIFNQSTPTVRNKIAHELLIYRPSTNDFENIKQQVKEAAYQMHINELNRAKDIKAYKQKLLSAWEEFIKRLVTQIT